MSAATGLGCLLMLVALLGGCRDSAESAKHMARPTAPDRATADDRAVAPCGKEVRAADVAAIFGVGDAAVAIEPSAVTPDACDLAAGPGRIVGILLRAGSDIDASWRLTIGLNHGGMRPLDGIGEQALMKPDGSQVLARQGDLSCQVDLTGLDTALSRPGVGGDPVVLARRLGALCRKVFVRRSGRPSATGRA